MTRLVSALALTILLAPPAAAEKSVSLDDFGWLTGRWVMSQAGQITEEQWLPAAPNAMLGVSRTLDDSGAQTFFEYLRIVEDDDGVAYVAQPLGRGLTRFALTSWNGTEAVFENREHDFPQVIRYRRTDGGLLAVIEGPGAGGAWASKEFSYQRASDVEFLPPPGPDADRLPFSEAVRVGNILFMSGKVGRLPGEMEVVPGGIQAETRQVMDNIGAVLDRHGSSFDRVVKCTVFLTDIAEWAAMNEVYRTYFPENKPARSALGANGLALGARVEIECIATVD